MKTVTFYHLFAIGVLLLVLLTKTPSVIAKSFSSCLGIPLDIVFVLDDSNSIHIEDFKKQLNFVNSFIDQMDIGMGDTQVRVGVESFSDYAYVKLTMGNSTDKAILENKIETLSRENAPWTNTADALRTLLSTMFKEEHGSRPNVKHVAILLTDGNSQDKEETLHAAEACHDANIKVFAVAIGGYIDHSEVKAIASNPKEEFYFKTKNFDTLIEILDNLIGRSCKQEIPECPEHPIDIVFILDDSNTIWDKLFRKQLNFVNNFIDMMNIGMGVNQVRVGVETFSEFAHAKVTMGNSMDKASLKRRIRAISRENAPWTNTGTALEKLLSTMFKKEHGSRPNVKHVAILLTDGNSQNKEATLQAAEACHDANIKVFAVAIGDNIDHSELKVIASDPKSKFYFQIPNFDALDEISNSLIERTCKEVKPPLNCQGNPVDIVFVLDGSNSIEDPHFQQELNFTSNFIEEFDIGLGDHQVRVGVEIFSNYTEVKFTLDSYEDKSNLRKRIEAISRENAGLTNTGGALKTLLSTMFKEEYGSRPNVKHVAILLTDGKSQKKRATVEAAEACHRANIQIFTVAVGDDIDHSEVKAIASDPKSQFYFHTHSFDTLDEIQDNLIEQTCIPF